MRSWSKAWVVLLAGTAAAAAGKYTEQQLKARYYFDLGPETIDVSSYPKEQQESYQLFSKTCSHCHTLARPINAPETSRRDWQRFINRMHARIKSKLGSEFSDEQARKIVDFLVFDSQERKVKGKAAFQAQTARLKAEFEDVKSERARTQAADAQKEVRPFVDQTQASPQPQP